MAQILPPPPAKPRPYQFPRPARTVLDNGLTVYVIEDHRLPLVSYSLDILAGNCDTTARQAGLAGFTAGLLRDGAGGRSSQEISALIDGCGGSLGASAGDDYTTAGGAFLKSYAPLGLELLSDIVLRPHFDAAELDRRRQQALSSLAVNWNDPSYVVSLTASRAILGDHPYAYPGDGTAESLSALTRDDLHAFWRRCYTPERAWFAVAGDITPDEGFALAARAFGRWKPNGYTTAPLPAPRPRAPRVIVVDMPSAVQTQIVIGQTGVARNHPDFLALYVANQVFGASFNSRLNLKIRAEEGLSYDASSGFEAQRQSGQFTVSTFTRTEKTAAAVGMIFDLLREFHANPATPEEFEEVRAYLDGSFALVTETCGQVADRILSAAVHGLGEEFVATYRERLAALRLEQVHAATRAFLEPDQMTVVAAGDARGFASALAPYGELTVIAHAELDLLAPELRAKS
jgi:zinc protease